MKQSLTKLGLKEGGGIFISLVAVLSVFIASSIVTYNNLQTVRSHSILVSNTHEVLATLGEVRSLIKDAESAQRGYLITGDERYLAPYRTDIALIPSRIEKLEKLIGDSPEQAANLPPMQAAVTIKLDTLARAAELRRESGFEAARDYVLADRGREAMQSIQDRIDAIQSEEKATRQRRIAEREAAYESAVVTGVLTALMGIGVSLMVAYLLRRAALVRRRQEWLQAGQIKLSQVLAGDQRVDQIGDKVLTFLADFLDAHAGAFFVKDAGAYRRVATYGVPSDSPTPQQITSGDGLVGQVIKDKRVVILDEVPDGYLTLGSSLGSSKPRQLMIIPALDEGEVNAVFELGFIQPPDHTAAELFDRMSESVGVAIRSANYRTHLQNLIEETQRQSEELQAQSEELRVSNEELEEQGRALRESQSRLENQQVELEQTNAQLEEQAQLLEAERDVVSRAKATLESQARELERASQYKSDFLANMSHELRTPLNSSLILAKLLADNPQGNLTAEQVEYAQTIQTSGNDLLTLINDILDLSKIEAGHMDIHPETVFLAQLAADLERLFVPVANEKGLKFVTHVAAGCPESIETDRQRLEQILKNLISNAVKFTEHGQVELSIAAAADNQVAITVSDTGIGIPPDQQQLVFEAFRQVDSTTSRKHGGTGLGLSISRQLVRLLGGQISLASEVGRGSTFTVSLPQRLPSRDASAPLATSAAASPPSTTPSFMAATPRPAATTSAPPARRLNDDRDRLAADRRVLLVVEDDEPFSKILYNLAHELSFQCLLATTAEDGFATAVQFLPHAVVLDLGLPDHSGLWVLDRLKHDQRTRHIPVHVISASDSAQTALSLGAVGYMLKPVVRDQVVDALKQLETKLTQRVGRVLIVEDDQVQRESLKKLLGSQAIETVGVATAADCLEQLKQSTFDCMVLDLSLPDASGFSLLETLSREDAYSFPPVIVYTGRELSAGEEQRLRRYSKSIIIKGAKSPERLLDEVTLFLHQVVSELPLEQQRMLERAKSRDAAIEGRRILVVEDDVRNVFALTSTLEPRGAIVEIARNGREALTALEQSNGRADGRIDLVLMDVMMPEMDGMTAIREIRKRSEWKKLPIIVLTAKAMKDDQEQCLAAGASDYIAKPLDVDKLLSLIRVWMPR